MFYLYHRDDTKAISFEYVGGITRKNVIKEDSLGIS